MAAEAHAAIDLPPFDRTAMDGFAVRAADVTQGAVLKVVGDLAAGGETLTVGAGEAARISTGAAIPEGADSILKVEDTEVRDGTVTARADVRIGLHIRRRGEDVHAGDVLATPGDVLTVPRLSALASAGVATRVRPACPARLADRDGQRAPAAGRAARAREDLRVQLARGHRAGARRGR